MAHSHNTSPWNLRIQLSHRIRHRPCCLANDLQVMYEPNQDEFVSEVCLVYGRDITLNAFDRFQDVAQPLGRISQSGMASLKTRSRIRSLSICGVTKSTGSGNRSRRSMSNPPRSSNPRPASRSTKRSGSLQSSSSPRATEPKARTLQAPCRTASARIASPCTSNAVWTGVMFRFYSVPTYC